MNTNARNRWIEFQTNPCEATFVPLHEATRRLVYTICFRILRNEDDALDASQAVYCRLLEAARRNESGGETPEEFDVAIGRLAIREADNLRKRRARRAGREVAMDPMPELHSDGPAPDAVAARQILRARLETLIETLPERHRLPLQLHYFHGLSRTEIAGMIGKPVSTVSRRIESGLKQLRPLLRRAGIDGAESVLSALVVVATLLDPPAKASAAAAAVYQSAMSMVAAGGAGAGAGIATGAGTVAGSSSTILSATAGKTGLAGWPAIAAGGVAGVGVVVAAIWFALAPRTAAPPLTPVSPSAVAVAGAASGGNGPNSREAGENPLPRQDTARAGNSAPETSDGTLDSADGAKDDRLAVHVFWEDTKSPVGETTITLKWAPPEEMGDGAGNTAGTGPQGNASAKASAGQSTTARIGPLVVRTDMGGGAEFAVPSDWSSAMLDVLHREAIDAARRVSVSDGTSPALRLEIAVRRGAAVYGHVRIEGDGRPAAGAVVEADQEGKRAAADSEGSYEIVGLAGETVRLLATQGVLRSAPNDAAREPIALLPGKRSGPHDLFLRPGAVLTGAILDKATGHPLPDAALVYNPGSRSTRTEYPVNAEGRYRAEGLPASRIQVAAQAPGFSEAWIWIEPSADRVTECNFRLERGLPLDIEVTDPTGEPIADAIFRRQIGRVYHTIDGTTDERGHARFEGISPTAPPLFSVEKEGFAYKGQRLAPTLEADGKAFKPMSLVMIPVATKPVEGVFIGRVTDEKGDPLAGATVQWAFDYDGDARFGDLTRTDSGGRFRLVTRSRDELRTLAARAHGFAPKRERDLSPGSVDSPRQIDFTLAEGHWVGGRVVDEAGVPQPGVSVYPLFDESNGREVVTGYSWHSFTDSKGSFRLDNLPGPRVVLRTSSGKFSDIERVVEVDGDVELVVRPKGEIRGRVVDGDTNDPIREFTVHVNGSGVSDDQTLLGQRFSDNAGSFTYADLNADAKCQLTVEAEGYPPALVRDVATVAPGDSTKPAEIVMRRGKMIEACVVDAATGQPVAGGEAVVALYDERSGFGWDRLNGSDLALRNVQRFPIESDGTFAFFEGTETQTIFLLPRDHARLRVLPGDRVSMIGEEGALRIPVDPGATVEGRLAIGDTPIPSVTLYCQAMDDQNSRILNGPLRATTEADGRFRLECLPPGRFNLSVSRGSGATWISMTLNLKRGDRISLDFASILGANTLAGTVLNGDKPEGDVSVILTPTFPCRVRAFGRSTLGDGTYEIVGLPAGEYRASLSRASDFKPGIGSIVLRGGEETIRINGDLIHDFQFITPRSVTGRIRFPNGTSQAERRRYQAITIEKQPRNLLEQITGAKGEADERGQASIEDGAFRLQGRFKGTYRMHLVRKESETTMRAIRIDTPLELDNMASDQDLGDLDLPGAGAARVRLVFDPPPDSKDVDIQVNFQRPGDFEPAAGFSFRNDKEIQTCSPIAPGTYQCAAIAGGYRTEPESVTVEIGRDDAPPELSFVLRPVGVVAAMFTDSDDQERIFTIRSATLTGSDGNVRTAKIIDPATVTDQHALLKSEESFAMPNTVFFNNLPGGSYDLVVEAEGYETYRKTVQVVPGKIEQPEPIPLKRVGE